MQVAALLADRLAMVADADSRVDWAMAEALAIGTLLLHRCAGQAQLTRLPSSAAAALCTQAAAPNYCAISAFVESLCMHLALLVSGPSVVLQLLNRW